MAYLGVLLAVLFDIAFQPFAPAVLWTSTAPSVALATAIYIGFRAGNTSQLGLAIVLGVLMDCFSLLPIGPSAFVYGATAYLALRIRRYVPSDALTSHVVASLFCALIAAFLGLLIVSVRLGGAAGGGLSRALMQALLTAGIAPFVFGIWDRTRFFRGALRSRGYEFA